MGRWGGQNRILTDHEVLLARELFDDYKISVSEIADKLERPYRVIYNAVHYVHYNDVL